MSKSLTTRQKQVEIGIKYLKRYIDTYDKQFGYLDYTDETIIDDILYGLGVAIDSDEYKFASGFRKFKERLAKHLAKEI